ncbi:hypothetical protein HMPREF3036_01343 [Sutterella sp. KLE1602]|nr:hypothetical protein HMPREF3036_01343 [Sutterella sp. KLE1602]
MADVRLPWSEPDGGRSVIRDLRSLAFQDFAAGLEIDDAS